MKLLMVILSTLSISAVSFASAEEKALLDKCETVAVNAAVVFQEQIIMQQMVYTKEVTARAVKGDKLVYSVETVNLDASRIRYSDVVTDEYCNVESVAHVY